MSEAKDLKRQANNLTELSIVDIGCNLEGVARSGDRVVFVPFCDEGERINARITHTGKSCLFAECTEVLTPSAFRVKPPCIHFMKCGGCVAQHLSRERQLSH
ncbi:MAG: hypothetical protein LBT20_08500 [Clostridiales bacterium]|nr:hypothetical protein [Clostridiales bacterium]